MQGQPFYKKFFFTPLFCRARSVVNNVYLLKDPFFGTLSKRAAPFSIHSFCLGMCFAVSPASSALKSLKLSSLTQEISAENYTNAQVIVLGGVTWRDLTVSTIQVLSL